MEKRVVTPGRNFRIWLYAVVIIALYRPNALASDWHSPRTAALGGAGRAGPLLNDAIYLNPSFASFLPTYAVGGNYLTFRSSPEHHGRALSVSIQDGRSEIFQAGAGYSNLPDGVYLHLGASKSFVKRHGFALGGKFVLNNQTHAAAKDATLSFTSIWNNWFQSAFVIDNIVQSLEGQAHGLYREYTIGTKFNLQGIVLVYFDPHYAPDVPPGNNRYGHELGLEFVVMQDLFLRLGNFRDSRVPYDAVRGRGYGFGIGWVAPRLSLDYGIHRMLEPYASTSHNFGVTVYF